MYKQDIASTFTHIIVHPSDWHLLSFKWHDQYYFSMCLVFGCHSSPFLYNQIADALKFMHLRVGVVATCLTTMLMIVLW